MAYARKSRADDGRSVREQEEIGRSDLARLGATEVTVRVDDGRSASRFATKARDDWPLLLADCAAGSVDLVWLWESSRGDRKLTEWSGWLDLCRQRGIKVHVATHDHTYDLSIARDWKTLASDGIDSAYESEKTSLRVLRDMAASAAEGKPHGPIPYGFRREYDPADRKLVEQSAHPEQAPIVIEIITRVAGHDPISVICADLNARGIPSPKGKTWSPFVVRRIAGNPAYIGQRSHHGEITPAVWKGLVDPDVHRDAVARLSAGVSKVRPGAARWMLSYLMTCAVCSGPLSVMRPSKRQHPVYRCYSGAHAAVRVDWADEFVTDLTVARLCESDVYDRLSSPGDATVVRSARAEAAKLRADLDGWRRSALAGQTTPASLSVIETGLAEQIRAADARAAALSVPSALRQLAVPAEEVAGRWAGLTVGAKKDALRVLFARIELAPAGRKRQAVFDDSRLTWEWRESF